MQVDEVSPAGANPRLQRRETVDPDPTRSDSTNNLEEIQ